MICPVMQQDNKYQAEALMVHIPHTLSAPQKLHAFISHCASHSLLKARMPSKGRTYGELLYIGQTKGFAADLESYGCGWVARLTTMVSGLLPWLLPTY